MLARVTQSLQVMELSTLPKIKTAYRRQELGDVL